LRSAALGGVAERQGGSLAKTQEPEEFMQWTPAMSVGVTVLDEDHKKLIGIINQLHFGIVAGHKREVLEAVLDHLVGYARYHFAHEEELLVKTGYLDTLAHKMEHEKFMDRICSLQTRIKSAPVSMLDLELMSFLRNWLLTHIQGSDKKYGPRLNAHGFF
jgi:hemerythrin